MTNSTHPDFRGCASREREGSSPRWVDDGRPHTYGIAWPWVLQRPVRGDWDAQTAFKLATRPTDRRKKWDGPGFPEPCRPGGSSAVPGGGRARLYPAPQPAPPWCRVRRAGAVGESTCPRSPPLSHTRFFAPRFTQVRPGHPGFAPGHPGIRLGWIVPSRPGHVPRQTGSI